MNIHEYQAKNILYKYGVKVPKGKIALSPQEAKNKAKEIEGNKWVVKAQIHAGGRGKAGGVKIAHSLEEVKDIAGNMIGMNLITPQTGTEGQRVNKVYIEEGIDIVLELYLGMTLDRSKGQFTMSLPQSVSAPSALKGIITGTVSEPGGRAVSAYKRIDIHPYNHYVGLKTDFEGYAQIGQPADILLVSVDQAGQAVVGRNLEIQVFKLQWNSILKRDKQGRYRYQSEKQPNLLRTDTLTSTQTVSRYTFTPNEYGEYQITVQEIESGSRSSLTFYTSGWGYSPWAMENPDRLDLVLDQVSYKSGETAQVQVKAPFAGKLLLTVEKDKILEWQMVTMQENSTTVNIPIKSIFSPNAYLSAILVRSLKSLEQHAPARAFGVVPIKINTLAKQLEVSLTAPIESQPNQSLTVGVQINQAITEQNQCQLTLAAVDEGILQLTNFQNPDPHRYFFRQRGLGVTSHDLYASILPEVESAKGSVSTGGDGIDAQRK